MAFCLGPFTHLLMHGPALRPFLAPIIPPLYTVRYAVEIIGVYAIGNKPGSPVVDRTLYKFVSCHLLCSSFPKCATAGSTRRKWWRLVGAGVVLGAVGTQPHPGDEGGSVALLLPRLQSPSPQDQYCALPVGETFAFHRIIK